MTLRVCFIGNSHLVALQQALADDPGRWPTLEAQFVPFRGTRTVRDTVIDHGILRPTGAAARDQMVARAGTRSVDLGSHDAVVVVGFNLKAQHALSLWKSARWPGLPSLAGKDVGALDQTLISGPAALASLAGYLAGLTGFVIAARVAAAVDRPVHVIAHPRLHRGARHVRKGQVFGLGRAVAAGDGPALSALFQSAMDRAAAVAGVRVLHQPACTIFCDLMTDAPWMAGQIAVDTPSGTDLRDDLSHPNAAYGALMLDQLMAAA